MGQAHLALVGSAGLRQMPRAQIRSRPRSVHALSQGLPLTTGLEGVQCSVAARMAFMWVGFVSPSYTVGFTRFQGPLVKCWASGVSEHSPTGHRPSAAGSWKTADLPFLGKLDFCDVAQTVVDQVLDQGLTQVTLNILGEQNGGVIWFSRKHFQDSFPASPRL